MGYTVIPVRFTVTAAHGLVNIKADLGSTNADPKALTLPFLKEAQGTLVTIQVPLAPVGDRFTFKDDRGALLDSNNVKWIRNNVQGARVSVFLYLHAKDPPLPRREAEKVLNRNDLNTRASS
jgi:hypothetical protein